MKVNFNVGREATEAYFASLDRFLATREIKNNTKKYTRSVYMAGIKVKFCFYTEGIGEVYAPQFNHNRADEGNEQNVFHIWKGNFLDFLPRHDPENDVLWEIDNDDCFFTVMPWGKLFIAYNKHSGAYYVCLPDDEKEYLMKFGHAAIKVINLWAKHNGLVVVHGAGVGIDNKGVLLCGEGGAGKSTLALSCLAYNMQFISEDYLLLMRVDNELFAYPIYSVACLNPDMRKRLTALNAPTLQVMHERGEREMLDLSAYEKSFCDGMKIYAAVTPKLSTSPAIHFNPSGKAPAKMILSTIRQLDDRKNATHIKALSDCLSPLPCYELMLGEDLGENARFLMNFIKEEL